MLKSKTYLITFFLLFAKLCVVQICILTWFPTVYGWLTLTTVIGIFTIPNWVIHLFFTFLCAFILIMVFIYFTKRSH